MKKTIYALIFLLMVGVALAQSQPPYTDPLRFTGTPSMTIGQPPPPSDGSVPTSCNAWSVRNEYCSGTTRFYEQCVQMVNSNIWNAKSQNCAELSCGTCENGVCVQGNGEGCGSSVTPTCGNGACDNGETNANCATDCTKETSTNNTVLIFIGIAVAFILWRLFK